MTLRNMKPHSKTRHKSTVLLNRILAFVFTLAAVLLTCALRLQWGSVGQWSSTGLGWAWLITAMSFFLGLMHIQTGWLDDRSPAILRLDWYLPVIKRLASVNNPGRSMFGRLARRFTPRLQSDWQKKKRGITRKVLRSLGLSWVASPVRRLCQSFCLMLFCYLFFYVCWPYHAQPNPPSVVGRIAFQAFDQESGIASFSVLKEFAEIPESRSVFVRPNADSESSNARQLLGEFSVVASDKESVDLKPLGQLSPLLLDVVTGVSSSREFIATDRDPFAWPDHYAQSIRGKEFIPAETFLMIDPLVSLSTAIASRSWVWSLGCAAAILLVCVVIPRGFCGYVCPLGTTIDLFDWAVTRRTNRLHVEGEGWWVHIKYYLLATILLAACGGILISGFFSAIPIVTRGYLFVFDPLQNGAARGWHLIPGMNAGHFLSIALFVLVLALGFLRPRFWCKYVCPSGAVFSIGNLFRATERKVESSCIHCNKCVEICPFDAIKPDFTTRTTDCTLCQSCAGVCPTHAIKFVERTNLVQLKVENEPPTNETALGRRGFLSLTAGTAATIAGASTVTILGNADGAGIDQKDAFIPVRPPGSVPEKEFLEMCIRCGECFKACPNNVLQAEGFQQGFEGLWTPLVEADWAGCESSCNACGQVCPTGAIRELPLEEKRYARMGLAIVNESSCLPFAGKEACDLCVQECDAAGYRAIEYTQVGVETDEDGRPIEGTGFAAPVVLDDKCVGCGLCQTRCYGINVKERQVLGESAIVVQAGDGNEDRLMTGSYKELHQRRSELAPQEPNPNESMSLESGIHDPATAMEPSSNPFGALSGEMTEQEETDGVSDAASPF